MVRLGDKPMIIYFVYKNEEIVYIGQTIQTLAMRKGKHVSEARLGRGAVLGSGIRKHGETAFEWKTHSIHFNQVDLDAAEKHLISKYAPRYNVQGGGKTNVVPWNKGRKETRTEVITRISESATNRKRTPRGTYSQQHRESISSTQCEKARLKGRPFIHNQSGKIFRCKVDAGRELGLNPQRVRDVLSDRHRMKSYQGHTFNYIDISAD